MEAAKEEGRKGGIEKGRIRKGKWFSRRGDLQSREERAAKNEIGGRREGDGSEVVRRAGYKRSWKGVRSEQGREKKQTCEVQRAPA